MSNFQTYSHYYDLLYKDKDYKAESDYVTNLIRKYDSNAESVLELGSGSGSHANFLCQNGFKVTGIERSQEMIDIATVKNINGFEPIIGDISNFKLNKEFDAVISLFHVISYLTDNESLISCFKLTNQHLKVGGLFLFDIWYSPAVYVQKPETRIKRLENDDIRVTRIAESKINYNSNIIDVNFEVNILNKNSSKLEIVNELHPMRHFSIPEIELLAKFTGFELLVTEEFLTGNNPNETTWGVCFLLKKYS